jgi:flagellin-specific chaperone FliS
VTLIHCFAGCATSNILAAVGLRFSDLFPDRARASRVQLQQAAVALRAQELEARARRRADGEARSTVRKLQAVADALGARLARTTDGAAGDALERLYHSTLNRLREAEIKLEGRQ